jgi:hypothetical protein
MEQVCVRSHAALSRPSLPSVLSCVRILEMAHRSSSIADSDIEPELSTPSERQPDAPVRTVLHASPRGQMFHDTLHVAYTRRTVYLRTVGVNSPTDTAPYAHVVSVLKKLSHF